MGKYTFKVDNKDSLHKKLIKLPKTYYRLENNGNGYTVHLQKNGTVEIRDISNAQLKWDETSKKIVLYEGNLPLKVKDSKGERVLLIEQDDIISQSRNNIVEALRSEPDNYASISHQYIKDKISSGICLSLIDDNGTRLIGVLNFINFNDENDPVLQMIKEETGGLYFTIENDSIFISDRDGSCLPVCKDGSCYKYQYIKDECDTLQASEISKIIESLTNAENAQPKFTLKKGMELSDDTYEAKIMLNDKPVANLPKIGYYMLDDQLVIRNHITKEEIKIPRDFHYLKVVKSSGDDDYRLTFCNFLGNEFLEYKRYDPQYSNVLDEYKYINLNCMKKEYKPNFCKLFNHQPSFFITGETTNPNSLSYCPADVFELTRSGKGKKMATLIDQFGFFNKEGKFQYYDYHTKVEPDVYDSDKINKEYIATDVNNEFYLNNDVILYTIPV